MDPPPISLLVTLHHDIKHDIKLKHRWPRIRRNSSPWRWMVSWRAASRRSKKHEVKISTSSSFRRKKKTVIFPTIEWKKQKQNKSSLLISKYVWRLFWTIFRLQTDKISHCWAGDGGVPKHGGSPGSKKCGRGEADVSNMRDFNVWRIIFDWH